MACGQCEFKKKIRP